MKDCQMAARGSLQRLGRRTVAAPVSHCHGKQQALQCKAHHSVPVLTGTQQAESQHPKVTSQRANGQGGGRAEGAAGVLAVAGTPAPAPAPASKPAIASAAASPYSINLEESQRENLPQCGPRCQSWRAANNRDFLVLLGWSMHAMPHAEHVVCACILPVYIMMVHKRKRYQSVSPIL